MTGGSFFAPHHYGRLMISVTIDEGYQHSLKSSRTWFTITSTQWKSLPALRRLFLSKKYEWGDAINFDGENSSLCATSSPQCRAHWISEYHFDVIWVLMHPGHS